MKSKNLKIILTILIPVFLLLIFLICFFASPAYRTIQAIKNNDCQQAIKYYSNVDDAVQNKLFEILLPNLLNSINKQYNNAELSLENVENIYHTITDFESGADVSTQQEAFRELKNSKNSYRAADEAMKTSNYAAAIENYRNVSTVDELYDIAQTELQNATNNYKNSAEDDFYDCILKNDIDSATAVINDALNIISDADLKNKKNNLESGIYSKILVLLNTINEWEIIKEAHAKPNEYCCYRIELAKEHDDMFCCHYVGLAANSLVQSGQVNSISGPVAWYRFNDEQIFELSYDAKKGLEASNSVSWDYTMSKKEKIQKLETLF